MAIILIVVKLILFEQILNYIFG